MEKHVADADDICSGCGWSSTLSRHRIPCEAHLTHLEESARQGCPRCDLLHKAVKLYEDQWPSNESTVVVRCHQQGVTGGPGRAGTGTRVSVWWPKELGRPWEPFGKREAWVQIGLEIFSQRPDLPWLQFSHRKVPTSATGGSLDFLRAMIDECSTHHAICNQAEPDIRTPTRLLRIVDGDISGRRVFLVTTRPGQSYPYTALSHCWGSPDEAKKIGAKKMPKTTRANLLHQHVEGIPMTDLTRTFQDAIKLTSDLGFEYTWIDSLCIIQQDAADWEIESVSMASVYGGANLVIAATCGANGNDGLYSHRDVFRYIDTPVAGGPVMIPVRRFTPGDWDHQTWQFGSWNAASDLDLHLHKRAWTFQERLLAKRIVHFTPMELIWECWTTSSCECGELQDERIRQAYPSAKSKHREAVYDHGVDERLRAWDDVIAGYSVRDITYYQDRVQAIASIALQFDNGYSGLGRYLCGLWEADLPMGLLWYSLLIHSKAKNYKPHRRLGNWTVPTWSWLSVQGDISHQDREVVSTPVAIVQSISYRAGPDNLYGAPLEVPCLVVRGRTVEIKVLNLGDDVDPNYMVVHSSSDEEYRMDADVKVPETPFASEAKILALQIVSSDEYDVATSLVLRPVGVGNQYERLGLASVGGDVFEKYGKEEDILLV